MNEEPKQEFKFIAIKNWSKYQSNYTKDWCKVYTSATDDLAFSKLSMFQRAVLIGIWSLRARTGRNVNNDATYVARAMNTLPTDRAHIGHAIDTLVSRGFLILTNEQDDSSSFTDKNREEKNKKRVDEKEPLAKAAAQAASSAPPDSPSSQGQEPQGSEPECPKCGFSPCHQKLGCKAQDQAPEPEPFTPVSEADVLAQDLFSWIGSPAKYKAALPDWSSRLAASGENLGHLRTLLSYAANDNPRFQTGIRAAVRRGDDLMDYLLVEKKENILAAMDVDESNKKQAKKSGSNKAPSPGGFEYREKQREI